MPYASTPGDGREPELFLDINTTPLIDVMLVLLIMLIVTIPIHTHAVKLGTSVSAASPQAARRIVTIEIDFDGVVLWDGEPLRDRRALDVRLVLAAAQPTQPEIRVRAHRLASYEQVIAVLAAAQRRGLARIGVVSD
jgi:biopolymer transport protein ExbD